MRGRGHSDDFGRFSVCGVDIGVSKVLEGVSFSVLI